MPLDSLAAMTMPGATGFLVICVLGYVLFASGLTYATFGIDRFRALRDEPRIPETSLLLLSALGGWPGAKLAQVRFRHKQRAQPFGTILNLVAAGQVVVLLANALPVAEAAAMAAALADETGGASVVIAAN